MSTVKAAPSAIPYVIIAVFIGFGLFIGTMVRRAMHTTIELVSADYYQQELAYQQRIDAGARTAALPAPVQLTRAADQLTIQLPAVLTNQAATGTVRFFRPSDSKLDFTVPFTPDAAGHQALSLQALRPGHWRVRLDFTAAGQTYFVEQELMR